MNDELTLLILAAGMGSRYGGLKQLDGVGPHDEVIMEYSIYDAHKAGIDRVVFVIRESFKQAFQESILSRLPSSLKVELAYQEFDDLPEEQRSSVDPTEREKPWGTAHAVWAARHKIATPFISINADDYYGPQTFHRLAEHLRSAPHPSPGMVGFRLANTLSPSGTVSRGICEVEDGKLNRITERTRLRRHEEQNVMDEVSGEVYPDTSLVSMNCWGFDTGFIDFLGDKFSEFIDRVKDDGVARRRAEFYLPEAVDLWRAEAEGDVVVLVSEEAWLGVTYPDDKNAVVEGLKERIAQGVYPRELWS